MAFSDPFSGILGEACEKPPKQAGRGKESKKSLRTRFSLYDFTVLITAVLRPLSVVCPLCFSGTYDASAPRGAVFTQHERLYLGLHAVINLLRPSVQSTTHSKSASADFSGPNFESLLV